MKMNDGSDDIYSLLNYSTLVPSAIVDNSSLAESNWQISAENKDEISAPSVPVVALDDGRFVLQDNDGQLYLLSMCSNYANEETLTEIPTEYSIPNAAAFDESDVTDTISVDEVPEKEIESAESPSDEEGEEKFMFLCAQCSNVFWSVEQCKDHMIKDHNMIISSEIPDVIGEDSEFVQLPLQPIDTNSSNNEKHSTNNETTAVNQENNEKDNQENSNSNSKNGVKNIKSGTAGECDEKDKEGNQNKEQDSAKVINMKSKRKKLQSDPDYDLRPFKCKHSSCVQRFRSMEALLHHKACHQAPTRREYACSQDGCQLKYDDWRHCAMHLWQAHNIDVDLYTCWMCDQHKAASRMALETHMRIHRDVREFACPECGKAFKQKAQLRNHRVTHIKKNEHSCPDAVTPRWYMKKKCDICFKTYADSKCLKKHIQAVHSKLKPYVCNVCGHSSARKAMLQAHLRQHTGEKPYACNTCNFKTGDHNSLRRHMMRHSGVRPYKCPHCSYASIQSTSYKNHLQIRHPGKEGVFHCQRCSYRTVSHASFLQHLSDHTNNLISATDNCDVQVFPENVAAAQLIYHCLSGGGGTGGGGTAKGGGYHQPNSSPVLRGAIKADVTASSTSGDGTKQTITIEIPTNSSSSEVLTTDDEDTTHCFLQPDEVDAGGITIPADPGHTNPPGIMPDTNPGITSTETQPQSHHVTHLVDFT